MENKDLTIEELFQRLLVPEEDMERLRIGQQPRMSTIQFEMPIPTFLKNKIVETMDKHQIPTMYQWIIYSLLTLGLYDDCIDYRVLQVLKKQWQMEGQLPEKLIEKVDRKQP